MTRKAEIGIIGGTGVYNLPGVEDLAKVTVATPYGERVVNVGRLAGKEVAFLTRHGEHHSISPGQINYRANIWALKELGVKYLFSTACSGSLNPEYGPGSFVLLDQFLEFTKNRPASFFYNDGSEDRAIAHIDLTHPYCSRLGDVVMEAGEALGKEVKRGATYVCVEGPRFESLAEIKMFRQLGGDLLAHTQYPEVALAREAEMCYAVIGIVANMGAGIDSDTLTATELKETMTGMFADIQKLLVKSIELVEENIDCECHHALDEAYL